MRIIARSPGRENLSAPGQQQLASEAKKVNPGMRKYRLTFFFIVTALLAVAMATIIVNHVIGRLAEGNLIRMAEENTAKDARHIEYMLRRSHSMPGMAMQNVQHPKPLTLEYLLGLQGLSSNFPTLVEGLNVVKLNPFDLNGMTVWSTDSRTIGINQRESPLYQEAVTGGNSSKLVKNHKVVHLDGVVRSIDVVETYLPLLETREGQIIGVLEIYRDLANDVVIQVNDARSTVLWTTIATMGGLFLVLVGFIVVADVSIYRSSRREMSVVEEANLTLEDRVQRRTQELEAANKQLIDAQDQLVRSEKLAAIGQLAGGVAHDLRNPLGAINNAAYYLKRRLAASELAQSNPKIPQFVQIIHDEVEQSNQIITDLLSFARVKAPSLSPNLKEVIEAALSSMDAREDVHIVKEFDPELPQVLTDKEQLRRVFMNLAINAQDAMPEGGELTVSTWHVDGTAEVAFSDTGVGIADEDMGKIFDPLFTTKTKGTGLGLAICEEIVSKHGGTISVVSKIGQGATFTVRLPLEEGEG